MKKILLPLFIALFSAGVKGFSPYNRSATELARLKMSLMYLKGVETFRLLFINLLGVGVCLIFLISGLLLVPSLLLFYAPWPNEVKMYVGFGCAMMYLLISVGIFSYLFSQSKWLEIFHASGIANQLASKSSSETGHENDSEEVTRKNSCCTSNN